MSQCSTCISAVKKTKKLAMSSSVLSCIHCLFSGGHEGAVFQPFDQHEVDDGGGGDPTEKADAVFDVFRVIEREDDAGEPLY